MKWNEMKFLVYFAKLDYCCIRWQLLLLSLWSLLFVIFCCTINSSDNKSHKTIRKYSTSAILFCNDFYIQSVRMSNFANEKFILKIDFVSQSVGRKCRYNSSKSRFLICILKQTIDLNSSNYYIAMSNHY